jgi:hypothetical protein
MAIFPFRRKVLALKSEVTYGTDPVPTAAANAILAMNGSIALEADVAQREIDLAFFGGKPFVLVGRRATIEFEFELLGSATPGTASPWGPMILACGFAQTLDAVGPPIEAFYNPISDAIGSCTIYFWMGAQRFAITGCRGNFEVMGDVKSFLKGKATFTGILAVPTSVALPAATLTAYQDPIAIETETFEVTLDGFAANTVGISINLNNDVKMHEGSEAREVVINDRAPTGTIRLYDPGVNVKDFWTLAREHTKVALSWNVQPPASPDGRIVIVEAPSIQLELPKFIDIDGARGLEIPYRMLPVAGNDEVTFSLQ